MLVKILRDFIERGFNEELSDHSSDKEKQCVVFVGETGCGKSYVINLILRASMADEFEEGDTESESHQPGEVTTVEVRAITPGDFRATLTDC